MDPALPASRFGAHLPLVIGLPLSVGNVFKNLYSVQPVVPPRAADLTVSLPTIGTVAGDLLAGSH